MRVTSKNGWYVLQSDQYYIAVVNALIGTTSCWRSHGKNFWAATLATGPQIAQLTVSANGLLNKIAKRLNGCVVPGGELSSIS